MTAPVARQARRSTGPGAVQVVQVVRAALLAVLALGLLGAVAATSVSTTDRTLVARAQAGDVALLQVDAPGTATGVTWLLGGGGPGPLQQGEGSVAAWVDSRGVRTVVEGPSLPEGTDLVATVLAAAPASARPDVVRGPLLRDRLAGLWQVAALVVLVLHLAGPQPRRATRWGWSWLLVGLPAGLGALGLLVREAPWSRRTTAEPAPPPGVAVPGVRMSGTTGFAVVLVVSVLLSLLGLGVELLPQASDVAPAPFDAVLLDGSTVRVPS